MTIEQPPSRISISTYGHELINMIPSTELGIHRVESFANAVIVTMIEGEPDPDTGEPRYIRCVSLMVLDKEMEQPLREEAHRILKI
tara:strand:- start:953 stop:1210 length:258 start_codon:yes stop_codon:yes gene_type:complete